MSLKNNSKKIKIITRNVFIQKSFFAKATGLMFRKKMTDFAMIFEFSSKRKIGITMFFVFFPIDVAFIDGNNNIIEIRENLKPFSNFYSKNKNSKAFIELPKGYLKKHSLKIGTKVFWDEEKLFKINEI